MKRLLRKDYKLHIWNMSKPLRMGNVSYAEDKNIRTEIEKYARLNYSRLYPKERYLNFIKKNLDTFSIERVLPQQQNVAYVYKMFCIDSQYVYGNCLEECIDIAIEKIKNTHS